MALFLYFLHNCKLLKKLPSLGAISTSLAVTKKTMMNTSSFYLRVVNWIKANKIGKVRDHLNRLDIIP